MKGKISAIGILLLLGVLLLIQTSVAYASVNLLQNPGFETGTISPSWLTQTITGIIVLTSPGHTGSYAVDMSSEGAARLYQNIGSPQVANYLEVWYKGAYGAEIRVVYSDGTYIDTDHLPLAENWQVYHLDLDTSKLVSQVNIYADGIGHVYFDDFWLNGLPFFVVPGVPFGTISASLAMLIGLVVFVAAPRLRRKQ